jgi:outer membrane receptor for ferrienterochelin and colicins
MKCFKLLLFLVFSSSGLVRSQNVTGVILGIGNQEIEKIFGATISTKQSGVYSDTNGYFTLPLGLELPDTLYVKAINYEPLSLVLIDTSFQTIYLQREKKLENVIITAKQESHSISSLNPLHTEMISSKELRKAACCNLSESFETNASVDVNITDAISGTRKIQMMGVDGVYTQLQMEGIPYFKGVESSNGISSMPGTWIESMQVTKGSGSVVYGYEPMVGLINLELKKPQKIERAYFNSYLNRFGRYEVNYNGGKEFNDKWSQASFIHYSGLSFENDYNKDGFRDVPKSQNASFLNRWKYQGERFETQFGVNAYLNDIKGGQIDAEKNKSVNKYGVFTDTRHVDVFAKTGFFFKDKPYQSIGVLYNFKYQDYNGSFGNDQFKTKEKRGYINLVYDGIINNTNHTIKFGSSIVVIDLQQKLERLFVQHIDNRLEVVPGVFGEYTFKGNRLTSVLGARIDYHNLFGFKFSPRLHSKYSINEKLTLRFSSGRGWRVPNYIVDNISLLASSKYWETNQKLQPEISWNNGISLIKDLLLFKRKSQLSIDFYRTDFQSQLIIDRDIDVYKIVFENLKGKSFSNSFQVELSLEPYKNLEVRVAYKILDVKADFGGELQQKVLLPKHRGFVNLGYLTRNKKWEFDWTSTFYGIARLPFNTELDNTSSRFNLTNVQVTHIHKKWDFYLGAENLFNYMQKNPIINSENPFDTNFDATRIWGPIMGTNIYFGLRFTMKKTKNNN